LFTTACGSDQECVRLVQIAGRLGFVSYIGHATPKSHLEQMATMISGPSGTDLVEMPG
jgi:hypothetical protein